ncbi:hypothetical protein KUCAC02_006185 [Chaenocephalus aceratus]|nr:hypothetical protein KUCAC02_006185 [Chaenocephalus aceratus]
MEQHGAVWALVLALSAFLHFDIVFAESAVGTKPGLCLRRNVQGLCHNEDTPGVCHRRNVSGMCPKCCSKDNDCPSYEACCHFGCGHRCSLPNSQDYTGKSSSICSIELFCSFFLKSSPLSLCPPATKMKSNVLM